MTIDGLLIFLGLLLAGLLLYVYVSALENASSMNSDGDAK